jgi:putative transposase
VRPLPGAVFKQFTARVVSRWDVIQAHTRATATTAAQFLDSSLHRMPFPICAVQVDGGSEFAAAYQQRGLRLFMLPASFSQTQRRPSNAPTAPAPRVLPSHALLSGDEKTQPRTPSVEKNHNTVRPHQSLGYLTPQPFLLRTSSQRKE